MSISPFEFNDYVVECRNKEIEGSDWVCIIRMETDTESEAYAERLAEAMDWLEFRNRLHPLPFNHEEQERMDDAWQKFQADELESRDVSGESGNH